MKGIVIDGWNLFTYDGIPNDSNDKKTIAVKLIGDYSAEIMLDLNTMKFEFVKNGVTSVMNINRFSTCLKMADEWFKIMEEKYE
jgi:hypothetical protein